MPEPIARRRFLQFLAASPLFAIPGGRSLLAGVHPDGLVEPGPGLIETAADALDVFDLERVAQQVLPPAHYGYIATGTDGNETLHANRTAFGNWYLRPRRMVDTSNIDTRTELLRQQLSSPILLAPAGSQGAFHADGELATARAARARNHLQILSNVTTRGIEDVIEARGAPVWFQLYPTQDWRVGERMLKRAERAGAPVAVLTVDLNGGSNRVPLGQWIRQDSRDCNACHAADEQGPGPSKPMYADTGALWERFETPEMNWDYLARMRDATGMQLVIKGIVTGEDATEAVRHGVDAVYVSNHGGRAEASGRGAIVSLPEVVEAVGGRVPVIVDSGFRRGTDIFKALALGADAVAVGRPYLWGLGAFGQAGVERALEILQAELRMVMDQMGTPTLADIGPSSIARH